MPAIAPGMASSAETRWVTSWPGIWKPSTARPISPKASAKLGLLAVARGACPNLNVVAAIVGALT